MLGALGAGLSQSAANAGYRPVFPGLTSQGVSLVGGLGGAAGTSLTGLITNPGAMPNVSGTVNPAFNALVSANQQMMSQGLANLKESYGASGVGTSGSPYSLGASNYLTQSNANFMNILAQYTLQTQQQAQQTQLAATGEGLNAFLGPAFTLQGPKGSVSGAALGSLGGSGLDTLSLMEALGMGA